MSGGQVVYHQTPAIATQPRYESSLAGLHPRVCFPLQLGRLVQRSHSNDRESESHPFEFPLVYKEKSHCEQHHYEREPADVVFQRWFKHQGIYLILGEPGGGKTTLMRNYAREGQSTMVCVTLRNVSHQDDPQTYLREKLGTDINQNDVVYLLDGWDELRQPKMWANMLTSLPGIKIITCRTAQYDGTLDGMLSSPVLYIMGLVHQEQRRFLSFLIDQWRNSQYTNLIRAGLTQAKETWAEKLYQEVQSHPNVRNLASSPLLLTLIALVCSPKQKNMLPKNRATFYEKAFYQLCKNRHAFEANNSLFSVTEDYLRYIGRQVGRRADIEAGTLVHAYRELQKDQLQIGFTEKDLKETALTSGILKENALGNYEFLHLTFQEWFLAKDFARQDFPKKLETYWLDPDYEEVLSLSWCMITEEQRSQATAYLIERGCQSTTAIGSNRSGLRTALHLWYRSHVMLAGRDHATAILMGQLHSNLRRMAVSMDRYSPAGILKVLATDKDKDVRMRVAKNPNTSAEDLKVLATDEDNFVRKRVAANPNTQVEVLKVLVTDKEDYVRSEVTANPNMPVEVLKVLAWDEDDYVRMGVTANPNTPLEVLKLVVADENENVRMGAAGNPNTSVEDLKLLFGTDRSGILYRGVAANPNMPAEDLKLFVRDKDEDVRQGVAANPNTPAEDLKVLATDEDNFVRRDVAVNPNTPAEDLKVLVTDKNHYVRRGVAGNPNTPVEDLKVLVTDKNKDVRRGVARNPNTCLEWF